MNSILKHAIFNNARWCNLVCSAAGANGTFYPNAWVATASVSRLYPNIASLEDGNSPLEHVHSVIDAGLPGSWGIKDSFASLALDRLGFTLLFDADWYWRQPLQTKTSDSSWKRVLSPADLLHWEQSWAGGSSPATSRTFNESLLQREEVLFLINTEENDTGSGLIANYSDGVVGISNVFGQNNCDLTQALATINKYFPEAPLVSYQTPENSSHLTSAGFETMGPLRVWLKDQEL